MVRRIRDVMTERPITMPATASAADAARTMREANVGAVIVVDGERLSGVVTDRDIVVRALALGREAGQTPLADIASRELTTVAPGDSVPRAVQLMAEKAVRRLPVVEHGRPVGIVTLGDLAITRAPLSALGEISAAPPNH